MTDTRRRVILVLILAAAAAIRLPLLSGGLPYLGYIDEGHVLHPVQHLARTGGWDPAWYGYPSLTIYAITGAVLTIRPIYRLVHGHSLLQDLPANEDFYDSISPAALVLSGRAVVLFASLLTVALGMSLARRLGGNRAAVAAGLLLAFCPALVQRSAIVIVDTVAALLTTATLLVAEMLREAVAAGGPASLRARRLALAAGALSGLAAAAKYPSALVFAAVALAALAGRNRLLERLRLAALAATAAVLAALVTMPALAFRARQVAAALVGQSEFYTRASFANAQSLFSQALLSSELGPTLAVASTLGLVALLMRPSARGAALGWIVFAFLLLTPLALYNFQPFRNTLPVVVVLLVATACLAGDGTPLGSSRIVPVLVVGAVLASFAPGLLSVARPRAKDSRVRLVDELAKAGWTGRRVLVQSELAILPSELARAACEPTVASWRDLPRLAASGRFDTLVFGLFDADVSPAPDWAAEAHSFEVRAAALPVLVTFGSRHTPVHPNYWRDNDELLVLARLPADGRHAP